MKRHGKEVALVHELRRLRTPIGEPIVKIGYRKNCRDFNRLNSCSSNQCGDDKGFYAIPTIWYYDKSPFYQLHTAMDTIDRIDFEKMAFGCWMQSIFGWRRCEHSDFKQIDGVTLQWPAVTLAFGTKYILENELYG